MKVSLVITNWNGRKLLEECLPSILKVVDKDKDREYEVLIVDDCSQDNSVEFIKSNFPSFKVLIPEHNLGFQGATNFGVLNSSGEVVILLNNDLKVREDSFFPLLEYFKREDVFAVGGKLFQFDETSYLAGNYRIIFKKGHFSIFTAPQSDTSYYIPFVCGGAGAFDKKKFLELGGFDNLFYPLYYEDVDICYRAWKRGWKCIYEPRSLMYHKHQATITTQVKKVKYLSGCNNYLFTWKNMTDFSYILAHLFFVPLFLLRDLIKRNFRFWRCIFKALKKLPQVLQKRKKEKGRDTLSDKEVLALFGAPYQNNL
ncbi:glycosyltransferase family 2 protein [bacterium]|nr:glycosyltransferase family 2 protein [bacterium]MBU1152688.1 glycosyltransferase family 2 protein [bacterium]MBU1782255.1 glycosyltransferase family 2 protein [bacterium]